MHVPRRRRPTRIAAWLACAAILLQAIVPALGHARTASARAGVYLGELCSIDRTGAALRLARAIDAQAPAEPVTPLPAAAHCPFCPLPPGADAPPPAPFAWDAAQPPSGDSLRRIAHAAPPAAAPRWRAQAPRAPPRA